MENEIINNRLKDLHNVLFYCSDLQTNGKRMIFKPNERICINQERGSLFTQLSYLYGELNRDGVRNYKTPPDIEIKIQFTLQKIGGSNLVEELIKQPLNEKF